MAILKPSQAERNKHAYSIAKVVADYRTRDFLQPGEGTLLRIIGEDILRMAVLDVGIGGGRTSSHLLGKVGKYLGIDYAEPMVIACRERFPHLPKEVFQVGDVRKLAFADSQFDFVFFSHNGFDSIAHEERLAGLRELNRVGRPGSWMALSTHNLLSVGRAPALWPTGLFPKLRLLVLRTLVRILNGNPRRLRTREWAVVRDDACRFKLRNYYVNPAAMVRFLREAGFQNTRIIAIDGSELTLDQAMTAPDSFFHYMSRNGKSTEALTVA